MKAFCADPANKANNKQIVISTFASKDLAEHRDGKEFVKSEYYANPENYRGLFAEYLDCVTWLVNGIYWEAKYPRVISKADLKAA